MDNEALIAARENDLAKLQELLGRVDINARDAGKQRSLLYQAAKKGHREVVQCLLRNGADVLLATDRGNTALHAAVTRNDDDLVRVILENVARDKLRKLLNARTKASGTAALHAAAKQNSRANASVLLQYGANYELKNNAGEKPVDLATDERLRQLLRLIGAYFAKARRGDERLTADLEACDTDADDFLAVMNCRNDEGRTFFQMLVLHCGKVVSVHNCRPPPDLFHLRTRRSLNRDLRALHELSLQNAKVTDELVDRARDCERHWFARLQRVPSQLQQLISKSESSLCKFFTSPDAEAAMQKAHELLLAYRRMEGKDKSLTINGPMKTLEEVFELFGFDTEQPRHAVMGRSNFSYERLPTNWSEDIPSFAWFFAHVENLIHESITYFVLGLTSAQMFHAAKNNDLMKMQQLTMDSKTLAYALIPDETGRTVLCYAVENGDMKMTKLLVLKTGLSTLCERGCDCGVLSPLYLAVKEGHAKIVKLLLKKAEPKNLLDLIDSRQGFGDTALHAAAKLGRLDLVKMLLRYGGTYSILDAEGRTPLDVSSNEEVSELFKLVESCFFDAKDANTELVHKLKAMPTDDFLAITTTKNEEGQTLAIAAAKANAKSVAGMILRMMREAKGSEK